MSRMPEHVIIKCNKCNHIHLQGASCLPTPAFLAVHTPIDWQRVRVEAAIAAMQGMYANPTYNDTPQDYMAGLATAQADALIAELQKKVEK